jgi:Trk K+ transport system NAD-binding subunit
VLAHIAGRIEQDDFLDAWKQAQHEQELKEILLRDERYLSLLVREGTATETLISKSLADLDLHDDTLVALMHRNGMTITPRGTTIIEEGDRLTIIGQPQGIARLRERYASEHEGSAEGGSS